MNEICLHSRATHLKISPIKFSQLMLKICKYTQIAVITICDSGFRHSLTVLRQNNHTVFGRR